MNEETLRRLESELRSFPVMSSGPPPEDQWRAELARLDFAPPPDYVEFIARFGGSIVGSYSIVGLGASSAMGADEGSVFGLTSAFRADRWPGVDKWIVFSRDLAGNPVGVDRDGVVWTWDHDNGQLVRLAASFEEFLLRYCLQVD